MEFRVGGKMAKRSAWIVGIATGIKREMWNQGMKP